MPCGIDDSDLEALRADDASFYGQDSAVSDTDASDSDHETARAAKRVDRGVEENDEVFSDVDFPINTGTGAAAHPELAAVLDKIQALWTTGCGCAMNDYLQFGDGQLASLFSSLGRLSKADKKNSSFWASWQRLCRLLRLRRLGANTHLCTPALAVRYVASLFWPFTILASSHSVVCKTRWTHQAPHKSTGRVAVNVLPTRHS